MRCGMCKKGIVTGMVGLAGLSALFFGTEAGSYCKMAGRWAKDSVKQAVPVSVEIERARQMVEELRPEIRKNMYVIAREEVEIKNLDADIARLDDRLGKQRTELTSLRDAATSGKRVFEFASRTYTAEQVNKDLHNRLVRCKTIGETLDSTREVRDARQGTLEAARTKLDNMLAQRTQLKTQIENLEAKLKRIEAEQTASQYALDDSQLSRLKKLVHEIDARLDVDEKMVDVEGQLDGEIPVTEEETPTDIVDQVTQYLGGDLEGTQVAQVPVEGESQQ